MLDWTTVDRRQHVAEYRAGPGRSCRLSVEQMAGNGWDWTVWCAQDPAKALHGTAGSRAAAIKAAELALPQLNCHCWTEAAEPGGEVASSCSPCLVA